MSSEELAKDLAYEIRALCEVIDGKICELRKLGYNNARVNRNDAFNKLEFSASKTLETKL